MERGEEDQPKVRQTLLCFGGTCKQKLLPLQFLLVTHSHLYLLLPFWVFLILLSVAVLMNSQTCSDFCLLIANRNLVFVVGHIYCSGAFVWFNREVPRATRLVVNLLGQSPSTTLISWSKRNQVPCERQLPVRPFAYLFSLRLVVYLFVLT